MYFITTRGCWFLVFVTITNALSCNYEYTIPGTSPAVCEKSGGIDAVVAENVDDLKGQLEGIKITYGVNSDLIKNMQENLNNADRQHEFATSQVENLKKEIDNIKSIISTMSDEATADDTGSVNPLAESGRILNMAVKEAEMKISNMTRFLQESARRRSIMANVLQSRIIQQRQDIEAGWKKVQDIERAILTGSTIRRSRAASQYDQHVYNLTSQTIELLVKAAAAKEISVARYTDLDFAVTDVENRLKEEQKKMASLRQDNTNLKSTSRSIGADLSAINNTLSHFHKDLIPILNKVTNAIPGLRVKVNKIMQDLQQVVDTVTSMGKEEQNVSQSLAMAHLQLDQLVTELAKLVANMTGQEHKIDEFEKEPLIRLQKILDMAEAEFLREKPLIKQLVNTIHGINATINTMQVPTLPQTGTGNTPRKMAHEKRWMCGFT